MLLTVKVEVVADSLASRGCTSISDAVRLPRLRALALSSGQWCSNHAIVPATTVLSFVVSLDGFCDH